MADVKRYYLARNRDHERVMSKITERDKPFLKIPGDEWVRAEDYDALADRLGALCAALQIAADSFRSHGFAVDADECEAAIASAARVAELSSALDAACALLEGDGKWIATTKVLRLRLAPRDVPSAGAVPK